MPIYVYRCDCGLRFERLTSFDAEAPGCPECGGATRKVPAGFSLGGQANPGLSQERMPQTWRGLYNGDREYVTNMQRTWERRQKLEAKHPELAGDQRPILAHEGRYHDRPLRAGDEVGGAPAAAHGHGHGHGHGHSAPSPAEPKPAAPRPVDPKPGPRPGAGPPKPASPGT
jgi:putative FmdB family regulatory protein